MDPNMESGEDWRASPEYLALRQFMGTEEDLQARPESGTRAEYGPTIIRLSVGSERKKARKNAVAGLASLLALGGCGAALVFGSGIMNNPQPDYREEEVAAIVEATMTAYEQPTSIPDDSDEGGWAGSGYCLSNPCETPGADGEGISVAPPSVSVPEIPVPDITIALREAWYGRYEGHADMRYGAIGTHDSLLYFEETENAGIRLEIQPSPSETNWESMNGRKYLYFFNEPGGCSFCDHFAYFDEPILYLPPENLSDIPGLTITPTRLTISPTEEQPYEILIEKVPGPFGGTVLTGTITEYDTTADGRVFEHVVIRPFSLAAIAGEPEVSIPPGLDQAHVDEVGDIYTRAASGEISESEAQRELDEIAGEIGKDAFSWIVRHMPVYSAETGQWQSFDSYAHDFAGDSGVDPNSRLGQDPVGVGVDLMFGDPSLDDITDWLGFGD